MADEKAAKKEVKLEIRADDDIANGVYANFIIANQSEAEFTLDFVFLPPASRKANVRSRVILSPLHAKRLYMLLGTQLAQYEKHFGEIKLRSKRSPALPVKGDDSLN